MKLRPKELEVAMVEARADTGETEKAPTPTAEVSSHESEQADEPATVGV